MILTIQTTVTVRVPEAALGGQATPEALVATAEEKMRERTHEKIEGLFKGWPCCITTRAAVTPEQP